MIRTSLFLLALVPSLCSAQPPRVRVTLADGSVIRGKLLTQWVLVRAPYGSLTVPTEEIRSIAFGHHLSEDDAKAIAAAIQRLDIGVHKERDAATRLLRGMGSKAIPALKLACASKDKERAARAALALAGIVAEGGVERTEGDVIVAEKMTVRGRIVALSPGKDVASRNPFIVQSEVLGTLTIDLSSLVSLHNISPQSLTLKLDAAKCGQPGSERWHDTGLVVGPEFRVTVTASGVVDSYPLAPGPYQAGPAGHTGYKTVMGGKQWPTGCLLGRVGDGEPFVIGEKWGEVPKREGMLRLLIVPSMWNVVSEGTLDVRVEAK